jgi:hypothetical protein
MRLVVLGLVAACSSPSTVHFIDAGQGQIDYTLSVGFDSTRPDMPQVFIDGVEMTTYQHVYPGFTQPIQHEVELRYADQVLARMPASAAPGDCGPPDAVWSTITQGIQAVVSGDLRYEGDQWSGDGGVCVGDGFGVNHCGGCPGQRCAPRIIRAQPLFTQMACAPIGSAGSGDPCTLTDDPAGAYDDCGENLVCIAGTCTPFCDPNIPPEYPPELTTRCP